jgi:uncharacterized coiled-coil protein SlyX
MSLAPRISALIAEQAVDANAARRLALKLTVELATARARIAQLEAQTSGQQDAIAALRRHDHLAEDLAAVRKAEREACARVCDELGFCIGAQRIRERT